MSRVARRTLAGPVLALGFVLAACSGSASPSPSPQQSVPTGSQAAGNVIDVAASEYKFEPAAITAPAGETTFRVSNAGSEEHEFEIFEGEDVVDEIEGLVPGIERDLTVTLEPGSYTVVCKLPGHEEAGMKGTLTVH